MHDHRSYRVRSPVANHDGDRLTRAVSPCYGAIPRPRSTVPTVDQAPRRGERGEPRDPARRGAPIHKEHHHVPKVPGRDPGRSPCPSSERLRIRRRPRGGHRRRAGPRPHRCRRRGRPVLADLQGCCGRRRDQRRDRELRRLRPAQPRPVCGRARPQPVPAHHLPRDLQREGR